MFNMKLAFTVVALTAGCWLASADRDKDKDIRCTSSTLLTVKSGLPFAAAVYRDGLTVPNGPSKKITIPTGSRVLAFHLNGGIGHIVATGAKLYSGVARWACTGTQPSGNGWTSTGFNDDDWPFHVGQPQVSAFDGNLFSNAIWLLKNRADIYCRAHLICAPNTPPPTQATQPATEAPTPPPATATAPPTTATEAPTTAPPTTLVTVPGIY